VVKKEYDIREVGVREGDGDDEVLGSFYIAVKTSPNQTQVVQVDNNAKIV